ncbi:MAG: hypothetical protein OEM66_07085 [Acidimicrobiia bacterium]|nr:hypothetical protein [Acidimicrobiia bacterium]
MSIQHSTDTLAKVDDGAAPGGILPWLRTHPVAGGALLGLAWGVSMRAWMRFISTNPEFSVAGTLFILGATTIAGSLLGLARHRRRLGGTGWWRLSLLSLGLLGAGGAVMWPTVVLWAAAIGRLKQRWLAAGLGLAGALAQISVIDDAIISNWRFTSADMAVAIAWYLPMLTFDAWAFSVVFTPGLAESAPSRMKRVLIAAGVLGFSALAVVLVGLGG